MVKIFGTVFFVTLFSCKPSGRDSESYPVKDMRGKDLVGSGDLSLAGVSPFPQNAMSKDCKWEKVSKSSVSVKLKWDFFEEGDPVYKRNKKDLFEEMDVKVDIVDGIIRIPGSNVDRVWLGGAYRTMVKLGNVASEEAGHRAARSYFGRDSVTLIKDANERADLDFQMISDMQNKIKLCQPLKDDVLDLTKIENVNAASTHFFVWMASLHQEWNEHLRNTPNAGDYFSPSGLIPLGGIMFPEYYVDYEFVAPDEQGQKTRFLFRQPRADNMNYIQRLGFSGNNLAVDHGFEVSPQSEEGLANESSLWRNRFATAHEFGHYVMAEIVERELLRDVTLTSWAADVFGGTLTAFRSLWLWMNGEGNSDIKNATVRHVWGEDWEQSYPSPVMIEFKQNKGSRAGVGADESVSLPNVVDENVTLTDAMRDEIRRRVELVMNAWNEGMADMFAAASVGSYDDMKIKCLGPDRDPRAGAFGLGRSGTSTPKTMPAFPVKISIQDPLESNESWMAMDVSSTGSMVAQDKECGAAGPLYLARPHVLGALLSNWLEWSVVQMTDKSFVDLPQKARMDLITEVFFALAASWKSWDVMEQREWKKDNFSNYTRTVDLKTLLEASHQASLKQSMQNINDRVFSLKNLNSWAQRNKNLVKKDYTPEMNAGLEMAQLRGLLP